MSVVLSGAHEQAVIDAGAGRQVLNVFHEAQPVGPVPGGGF